MKLLKQRDTDMWEVKFNKKYKFWFIINSRTKYSLMYKSKPEPKPFQTKYDAELVALELNNLAINAQAELDEYLNAQAAQAAQVAKAAQAAHQTPSANMGGRVVPQDTQDASKPLTPARWINITTKHEKNDGFLF